MRKSTAKKLAVVAIIALAVVLVKVFNLEQYLTLSYLQETREKWITLYSEHRLAVIAAYAGVYIMVTALSIPGAAVMTLAGGAFFGLIIGTLVVSFASTIGATLAFLASRFLLRDWVQNRFGDKLTTINNGIEREGSFYLFTMRLIPVFPFFAINLLMGLTKMPAFTYFWVSQVGMFPGTIVYVNAGKELARIEALSDIMSLNLIAAFSLLGILPLASKKIIGLYRSRTGKG